MFQTSLRGLLAALLTAGSLPALAAKTFVFCSEGSPEGFNPQYFQTGTTFDASSAQIFNRLVEFELGSTTPTPSLATAWEISPDGLHYTLTLRRGVKFQRNAKYTPSRDFNADDVLYTWNRMADAQHPFHRLSPGQTYSYFEDMGMAKTVERVEKLDDYRVRFVLKHPEAAFLANLAMDFMSILSAEHAEKMKAAGTPELADREPIGTGPFVLTGYQKDAVIRYQAHDAYWDGRPKIDKLVFAITPDAAVRYAKLKRGECHLMAYPKPADLALMRKDKDITLMSMQGLNVGYLAFNVEKKPFDDQRVRQAINMAINKAEILSTVYQGAGQLAKNPIPPTLWSYNERVTDYPFAPEQARKLLAEAGLAKGFEFDLWYLPVQRPYNPDGRRMGEMIQADLAKLGIKVNLLTYEWGEYRKRSKNGEHQAMLYGWSGDNGDPDNFFSPLFSCDAVKGGGNSSRWCNKTFDALIEKAARSTDRATRTKLYEEAQVLVKEAAPWVTIAHSMRYEPVRKEVRGYRMSAVSTHYFHKVDLAK